MRWLCRGSSIEVVDICEAVSHENQIIVEHGGAYRVVARSSPGLAAILTLRWGNGQNAPCATEERKSWDLREGQEELQSKGHYEAQDSHIGGGWD
jgi:hypothetical protein